MLLLVTIAFVLRCYQLTAPLLDYHSWRQADTAAIARNYALNGYHWLYPQVDWGGLTPGYVESEFPLYSFSLALLYGTVGEHEWLGRLMTAPASAGAVGALYVLALPEIGRRAAFYAGLSLALMPFALYFGRTVMPDSLMLLTAILALWSFRRWQIQPTTRRFALALVCGIVAPLAKTPNLIILALPLVYLVLATHPPRCAWGLLLLYGACFTFPALLWTRHAQSLPLDPRLSFGIGEKLLDLRLLSDPQFYLLLARWSVENLLTLAGLPFFLLGLVSASRRTGDRETGRPGDRETRPALSSPAHRAYAIRPYAPMPLLPHVWLFGVILFLLIGAAGVVGQDYYILPLAGPFAWFVGVGIDRVQRWADTKWRKGGKGTGNGGRPTTDDRRPTTDDQTPPDASLTPSPRHPVTPSPRHPVTPSPRHPVTPSPRHGVPIIAFIALAALSFARVAPLYQTADFYQTLGQRVDLALPQGERVGVIAPAVSEILYYGNRAGWRLDPGVIVPGGLASLGPDLGVRYLLIVDPWLTERRDILTEALRQYRRVPVGPYALLLDLAQPGVQQPAELVWETGRLVEEPFLPVWRELGGVERLGYPLTDALPETQGRVQYFERAAFLQTQTGVERLPVGRMLLELQRTPAQPTAVDESFRAAWERAGGDSGLGAALTPIVEQNDGMLVQYFEYGILEVAPGGEPAIGASGRRLLDARGWNEEREIEMLRER
jgi:hypothetical protein